MPKQKYFVEYDQPARLEIKWAGGWFNLKENFSILYDGQLLGFFEKRSELENGQEFQLPDGSLLKVSINSNYFNILHNGKSIHNLNNAKGTPLAAFIAAAFLFILGLSTFVFKAKSWSIRFYEDPIFYVGTASPFYVNIVGSITIVFAFAFSIIGFYARRNFLVGYLGFNILLLLVVVIFGLVMPYLLSENINAPTFILITVWLVAICVRIYTLKRQQTW